VAVLLSSVVMIGFGVAWVYVPAAVGREVRKVLQSAASAAEVGDKLSMTADAASIAEACNLFALSHGGHYPEHLSELLIDHLCPPETILRQGAVAGVEAKIPAKETEWRKISGDVDAGSKFVYAGAGVEHSAQKKELASQLIVVYSASAAMDGSREVGFADESGKLIAAGDLAGVVAESDAARMKLGLAAMWPIGK